MLFPFYVFLFSEFVPYWPIVGSTCSSLCRAKSSRRTSPKVLQAEGKPEIVPSQFFSEFRSNFFLYNNISFIPDCSKLMVFQSIWNVVPVIRSCTIQQLLLVDLVSFCALTLFTTYHRFPTFNALDGLVNMFNEKKNKTNT